MAGFDIVENVAHHPGLAQVKVQVIRSLPQQPRLRLATGTFACKLGDATFGMVGAEVKTCQWHAMRLQHLLQMALDAAHVLQGEVSTGYARLVADHDNCVASFAKPARGFRRAWGQSDFRTIDV